MLCFLRRGPVSFGRCMVRVCIVFRDVAPVYAPCSLGGLSLAETAEPLRLDYRSRILIGGRTKILMKHRPSCPMSAPFLRPEAIRCQDEDFPR